tara:strand:- start:1116 stop:1964 length:849 start_codon:yes stop_codon:yes gene_type:complete
MGNDIYGPALRSLKGAMPHMVRRIVLLLELGLVVLLAYQLALLAYEVLDKPQPQLQIIGNPSIEKSIAPDLEILKVFDPFYRQLSTPSAIQVGSNVPESTLRVDVFGLRATGDGQGTAIVQMQDGNQKLVHVGDTIANGVSLVGVFVDRLEITRSGVREAVFLRPRANRAVSQKAITPQPKAASSGNKPPEIVAMFTGLQLTPVRRNRRIVGFRLPSELPPVFQFAGLEAEDIILAVNRSPLTSHERLNELAEEIADAEHLNLEIERRGEKRQTVLRLKEIS